MKLSRIVRIGPALAGCLLLMVLIPASTVAGAVGSAASPSWTADYIRVDPFGGGGGAVSTMPIGIDNKGEVLINALTSKGYEPPMLWSKGALMSMQQFTPGAPGGAGLEISPTGNYIVTSDDLLKRGGEVTPIVGMTGLTGVNDNGEVSGMVEYYGVDYPAVWYRGKVTQLFAAHGDTYGINDSGQVAGGAVMRPGQPVHAFVWKYGETTDIGNHLGSSCGSLAPPSTNLGRSPANTLATSRRTPPTRGAPAKSRCSRRQSAAPKSRRHGR